MNAKDSGSEASGLTVFDLTQIHANSKEGEAIRKIVADKLKEASTTGSEIDRQIIAINPDDTSTIKSSSNKTIL